MSFLKPQNKKSKRENSTVFSIPWSAKHELCVVDAKKAIKDAKPDEAIESLSRIDVPALNHELNLLANRLSKFNRDDWRGIQTNEIHNTTFNKVAEDILGLIQAVEYSMAQEGEINSTIKDYLFERYENRLQQKLGNRQPINLSVIPSTEGTSEETSDFFITVDQENIQAKINDIFHEARGRLLIMGAPGSGKTVLMLQLALSLLKERKGVIPVLLNLATWKEHYNRLESWLEVVLPAEIGVNATLATKVLEDFPLILLLDGFDEIDEDDRYSCLDAIGRYSSNPRFQFAITTREEEYITIRKDAPVYLQLKIEPLQTDQILKELHLIGYDAPEAKPLADLIEKDDDIKKIVSTPIYLNLLQSLFSQGVRWPEINAAVALGNKKDKILICFLHRQLSSIQDKWAVDSSSRWLSVLAYNTRKQNLVDFELTDIQYLWWNFSKRKIIYAHLIAEVVKSLRIGIIIGVAVGLFTIIFGYFFPNNSFEQLILLGIDNALTAILILTLSIGLLGGLIKGALIHKNKRVPNIYARDPLKFSLKQWLRSFGYSLLPTIIIGIPSSLFLWWFLMKDFSMWIVCGSMVFFFMLYYGITDYLSSPPSYKFVQFNKPYQRFSHSARSFHFSILQHWHLRYLLRKKNLLPKDLIGFLNDAAKLHILETDGARWRFRHRILRDFFQRLWFEHLDKKYKQGG